MNFKVMSLLIMLLFSAQSIFAQKSYDALVYEGNKDFDNKNYDAAASNYVGAIQKNSKNFSAHYNLGNTLYKDQKYKEAQNEYTKASKLATNLQDKAAALHNLGNSYMKMKEPKKAAEFYKQALKQEPYSEFTRKNYEIAKLEQKQQEEQKNKENQGKEESGDDKKEGDDGEKGDRNNPAQPGGNGENQQGNQQSEDDKGQEESEKKVAKELEDAILDRATSKERETAQRILNKNSHSMPMSNEKDW